MTCLQSPTPEPTPSSETSSSMLGSSSACDSMHEPQPLTFQLTKKKFIPLRPGMTKGHTTSEIPRRSSAESRLPPFRFGGGVPQQTVPSSLSLSEAFESSPPSERPQSSNMPGMAPPRFHPFSNVMPTIRGGGGSPSVTHVRKFSNPPVRPRKQARRSHSMFENPGEILLQQNASPKLESIRDLEHHVPKLPHFNNDEEGVPRITGDTMIDVLDGKYSHVHDKVIVIDCRFEYEYNGGHINGAINFNDKEKLAEHLFDITSPTFTSPTLVIFHCEYSAHRAPIMAKFFRSHDRNVNPDRYPALTYPEAYILDGGYSMFFKKYRSRCFPQEYVAMGAEEHSQACEEGMGKVKKQRIKYSRAQTFAAFGQDSSPIGLRGALNRHASDNVLSPTTATRTDILESNNSAMEISSLSSDTIMSLCDSDVDMDTATELPTFNQPSFGRQLESGRSTARRMFSSFI